MPSLTNGGIEMRLDDYLKKRSKYLKKRSKVSLFAALAVALGSGVIIGFGGVFQA